MKAELVLPLIGLAGTLADHITTQIGLRIPTITEMNPLANPLLEGIFAAISPLLILKLGDELKTPKTLTIVCASIPALIPSIVAIRNLAIILLAPK